MTTFNPLKLGLVLAAALIMPPHQLSADEKPATTTLKGAVQMPTKVPEGVDIKGLVAADAVVVLKGKYNYPRPPYPENWKKMKLEERRAWRQKFDQSDANEIYQNNRSGPQSGEDGLEGEKCDSSRRHGSRLHHRKV